MTPKNSKKICTVYESKYRPSRSNFKSFLRHLEGVNSKNSWKPQKSQKKDAPNISSRDFSKLPTTPLAPASAQPPRSPRPYKTCFLFPIRADFSAGSFPPPGPDGCAHLLDAQSGMRVESARARHRAAWGTTARSRLEQSARCLIVRRSAVLKDFSLTGREISRTLTSDW